jgi:hypothetical protein
MTETDLAYLAGLLDAVGRFRVHVTDDGTHLAHVGISSPNLALLRWCARLTGVRVTNVRRDYDRLGCGEHCDEPHLHVESVTGRWQLVGARALVVLLETRPYLQTRGDEADAVIAATRAAPVKPATLRKMRSLGWAA